MTSANVIHCEISLGGKVLETIRLNYLCKFPFDKFAKYKGKGCLVKVYGYDEDEEYWDEPTIPLEEKFTL